jgi:hypothetical protein
MASIIYHRCFTDIYMGVELPSPGIVIQRSIQSMVPRHHMSNYCFEPVYFHQPLSGIRTSTA